MFGSKKRAALKLAKVYECGVRTGHEFAALRYRVKHDVGDGFLDDNDSWVRFITCSAQFRCKHCGWRYSVSWTNRRSKKLTSAEVKALRILLPKLECGKTEK